MDSPDARPDATPADVVAAVFDAYHAQDRAAAERVIADDLVFTSPQDDHIDRAAYFERCFPTADRFASHRLLRLAEIGDDGVFLQYEYQLEDGATHRNTELLTVRDGQVHEIEVYFGGKF